MIKELVTDTETLSTPCVKACAEDAAIADDLVETLASLEDAACLAANQIGETKCIIAFKDENDGIHVMFNPVLKQALYPNRLDEECLSFPGKVTTAKRFNWIKISYDELEDGVLSSHKIELTGWYAQLVQHMMDHCKGKLV